MAQTDYLLNYLQKGNTITSYEASTRHGITQLGARLDELEEAGHKINRRWTKVPTRHSDKKVKAKEYWLASAEKQGSMFGPRVNAGVLGD